MKQKIILQPVTPISKELAVLPANITVKLLANNTIAEFSNGTQSVTLDPLPADLFYRLENKTLILDSVMYIGKNSRRLFLNKITGTYISLVKNAIKGLQQNFVNNLVILGVGYKFYDEQAKNGCIRVAIGYSHPVFIRVIDGVKLSISKDSINLTIKGPDKQLVGMMASKFLAIKKFNRYSMNGIKHVHADIKKKAINKKN